jgi:hypothetical protein
MLTEEQNGMNGGRLSLVLRFVELCLLTGILICLVSQTLFKPVDPRRLPLTSLQITEEAGFQRAVRNEIIMQDKAAGGPYDAVHGR